MGDEKNGSSGTYGSREWSGCFRASETCPCPSLLTWALGGRLRARLDASRSFATRPLFPPAPGPHPCLEHFNQIYNGLGCTQMIRSARSATTARPRLEPLVGVLGEHRRRRNAAHPHEQQNEGAQVAPGASRMAVAPLPSAVATSSARSRAYARQSSHDCAHNRVGASGRELTPGRDGEWRLAAAPSARPAYTASRGPQCRTASSQALARRG